MDRRYLDVFAQDLTRRADLSEFDDEDRLVLALTLIVEVSAAAELDKRVSLIADVAHAVFLFVAAMVLEDEPVLRLAVLIREDGQLRRDEPAQETNCLLPSELSLT